MPRTSRLLRVRTLALGVLVVLGCTTVVVDAGAASSRRITSHGSSSSTVWLCRPATASDPCAFSPAATAENARGLTSAVATVSSSDRSRYDCFYVYPTVSTEQGANADLRVQPAETAVAVAQASRFSSVCNVWAPMYRQRTLSSLLAGLGSDPASNVVAYDSLASAFKDYLAHDNGGRPIIFIGHSQGAAMLILLLRAMVDHDPLLKSRLVLAIIAGGNVTVSIGKTTGGSFSDIPVCTSSSQFGCVIAYSSFPSTPPADSLFGRPGQGVSLQWGERSTSGVEVACVNPASISGGKGELEPFFFAATVGVSVSTPWVTFPGLYSAQCKNESGASFLQVSTTNVHGDNRPVVSEQDGPTWGYHGDDVNLALGNLVADVQKAETAYAAKHTD